jgi:hypothetical protein
MLILPENIGIVTRGFHMTDGSERKCVRSIRKIKDVPINHPEILKYIRGVLEEGFSEIKPEA